MFIETSSYLMSLIMYNLLVYRFIVKIRRQPIDDRVIVLIVTFITIVIELPVLKQQPRLIPIITVTIAIIIKHFGLITGITNLVPF